MGLGRAVIAIAQMLCTAVASGISLAIKLWQAFIAGCMWGEGNCCKGVDSCLAEGHDGKEGTIHDGEAVFVELFTCIAKDDFTKLIFYAEGVIAQHIENLIGAGISGIEHKSCLIGSIVSSIDFVAMIIPVDAGYLYAVQQLYLVRVVGQFLKIVIPQYTRIIGIFTGQEGTITDTVPEIAAGGDLLTGNFRSLAEIPELLAVRPGKIAGSSVNFLELSVYAKIKVPVEAGEIPG